MKLRSMSGFGLVLSVFAGSAMGAAWDLSTADFATDASFSKAVTFTDAASIVYDFVYPAGSSAATGEIELTESQNASVTDIQWQSVSITNGTQTTTFDLVNGDVAQACGPGGTSTRQVLGGGVAVLQDARKMTLKVTGMPLVPTLRIVLSGTVVGTGATVKGAYQLSAKRILTP